MVQEKIRNYEVAKKRHETDTMATPVDTTDLPLFKPPAPEGTDDVAKADGPLVELSEGESSDVSAIYPRDNPSDSDAGVESLRRPKARTHFTPLAIHCGELPAGLSLQHAMEDCRRSDVHHQLANCGSYENVPT